MASPSVMLRIGDSGVALERPCDRIRSVHARDFAGAVATHPNPVPFDPPAAADHLPAALPGWGLVTPFVLRTSEQFCRTAHLH
jgi:hypothetical protein